MTSLVFTLRLELVQVDVVGLAYRRAANVDAALLRGSDVGETGVDRILMGDLGASREVLET